MLKEFNFSKWDQNCLLQKQTPSIPDPISQSKIIRVAYTSSLWCIVPHDGKCLRGGEIFAQSIRLIYANYHSSNNHLNFNGLHKFINLTSSLNGGWTLSIMLVLFASFLNTSVTSHLKWIDMLLSSQNMNARPALSISRSGSNFFPWYNYNIRLWKRWWTETK